MSLSCRPTRGWRLLLAGVPALAAMAVATWALQHLELDFWPAALAAVLAGLLAWRVTPATAVQLAWDGQQWLADSQPGELGLMLDLGPWMLLRWRGGHTTRWLPVSSRSAGPHWHGLRVAAYARAADKPAAHV